MACPNGIPEGEEGERLVKAIKEKIAKDRPEWAEASDRANQASEQKQETPPGSAKGYSAVKANIIQQAQQEQIPEDPNERYFYEKDKEATENREQRKAEEREQHIRKELFKRLQDRKKGTDDTSLEKMLQIHEMLEKRLQQSIETSRLKPEPLHNSAPKKVESKQLKTLHFNKPNFTEETVTEMSPVKSSDDTLQTTEKIGGIRSLGPTSMTEEKVLNINKMDREEKIEYMRVYNQARKAQLKSRFDILSPRRPGKSTDDSMSLSLDNSDEANDMDLSMDKTNRQKRQSIEIS